MINKAPHPPQVCSAAFATDAVVDRRDWLGRVYAAGLSPKELADDYFRRFDVDKVRNRGKLETSA